MTGTTGSMELSDGRLVSDQGASVLRDVPASVTARQCDGAFDGLVLGVRSKENTSSHDVRLGKVGAHEHSCFRRFQSMHSSLSSAHLTDTNAHIKIRNEDLI